MVRANYAVVQLTNHLFPFLEFFVCLTSSVIQNSCPGLSPNLQIQVIYHLLDISTCTSILRDQSAQQSSSHDPPSSLSKYILPILPFQWDVPKTHYKELLPLLPNHTHLLLSSAVPPVHLGYLSEWPQQPSNFLSPTPEVLILYFPSYLHSFRKP